MDFCSPKQKECIRTPGSKLAITEDCTANVVSNYKFYLAFENCNCREYITEKFWRNALQTNSVPIVMGAPREDLRRFAPPGSYIHVDDFETVEQLANYLQELDADDVAYSRYFRWKQLGEVFMMPRDAYCRLCEALHDANAPVQWYDHIDYWWSKTDCVAPHKDIDEETGMGLRNDPNKFKISAPK
ncbi:PREDICTED: glycoprotein 3-alpha-L-fucosyltransferase A-like [Priapulus caudatus]|uniref:Fucosyltransferase n=1 Tax=Priapulus caudatus TaxID=37621 RepID=A0ABM1F2W0_PRICU|nr:PREDICTED: glycoprotein 3-alpha-L-fucosyltransferase A-like [Priapulus caudatus]